MSTATASDTTRDELRRLIAPQAEACQAVGARELTRTLADRLGIAPGERTPANHRSEWQDRFASRAVKQASLAPPDR